MQSLLNPKEAAVIFVVRTIVIFSVSNKLRLLEYGLLPMSMCHVHL